MAAPGCGYHITYGRSRRVYLLAGGGSRWSWATPPSRSRGRVIPLHCKSTCQRPTRTAASNQRSMTVTTKMRAKGKDSGMLFSETQDAPCWRQCGLASLRVEAMCSRGVAALCITGGLAVLMSIQHYASSPPRKRQFRGEAHQHLGVVRVVRCPVPGLAVARVARNHPVMRPAPIVHVQEVVAPL